MSQAPIKHDYIKYPSYFNRMGQKLIVVKVNGQYSRAQQKLGPNCIHLFLLQIEMLLAAT